MGKNLLEQFLPSVIKHSQKKPPFMLLTMHQPMILFPFCQIQLSVEIKIIQNKENGGYAKGYNDSLELLERRCFLLA